MFKNRWKNVVKLVKFHLQETKELLEETAAADFTSVVELVFAVVEDKLSTFKDNNDTLV